MEQRESKQNYMKGLFEILLDITKDFEFSKSMKGEPEAASREELHRFRLKGLISSVRLMAMRKYRQMPFVFRMAEDEEDWIQEAFQILYFHSLRYQPKPGYCYNDYIKWIVNNGLKSKQRAVYSRNPADDEALRKIVAAMTREVRREVSAREIADFAGVDIEDAQRFVDRGAGRRMFEEWSDSMDLVALEEDGEARPGSSPEKACMRKELRMILLECLEMLRPWQRWIVLKRYFEEESFVDIARHAVKGVEAVRSQARRGFEALRDCVLRRYEVTVPA